ncbi:MAG: sugar-binding transcriptional regulator [Anaerolineae bacterium]
MNFLDERRLLVKISRLYYEQDMTQSEIGSQLRISRQKVQRMLQRAQEEGIVRTWIQPITGVHADLEQELAEHFELREALVVETVAYEDQGMVSRELGGGAAEYLLRILEPGDKLVISNWSRTIAGMVDALRFSTVNFTEEVTVIQGLSELTYTMAASGPSDLTRELAKVLGGRALLIPAPGVAANSMAHDVFCADPIVAHILDEARSADIAFMGIGAVAPEPAPPWGDIVSEHWLPDLRRHGAVGEINLHYYDAEGRLVSSELDQRLVGLTLDEIRRLPLTVCVAGGKGKLEAIHGALKGKLTDVLITDHITADRLLNAHAEVTKEA